MDTTSLTKTVNNNFIAQQITQIIKSIFLVILFLAFIPKRHAQLLMTDSKTMTNKSMIFSDLLLKELIVV